MVVTANGLSFHVVDEGSGQPVLLLHGFPDSSALWRHQIPALVEAGHRVIAPDLRGLGASDRPDGVAHYAMSTLVADVVGILDALGVDRVDLVGHDWGAGIGWVVASVVPQRVRRYVALSVGHTADYFADVRQREMSWYMWLFLADGVAEEALRRDAWALLRAWTRDPVDIERYVVDLGRPGALTAALNYYRANIPVAALAGTGTAPSLPPVSCPVLGVWSDGDIGCGEAQMLASEQQMTGPWRYHRIAGAGHWIPLDAPDELSSLLVEFLGAG